MMTNDKDWWTKTEGPTRFLNFKPATMGAYAASQPDNEARL